MKLIKFDHQEDYMYVYKMFRKYDHIEKSTTWRHGDRLISENESSIKLLGTPNTYI